MADNPFPGMNPYLENVAIWRGVHTLLITYLSGQLNRHLPENFVARVEERSYVVQDTRSIYPDFAVYRRSPEPSAEVPGATTITLTRTADPGVFIRVEPITMRERFIEIIEVRENTEQIVTIIELLSPANKGTTQGQSEYQKKQWEVLLSAVHLLEIDLLRAGQHTIAVPEWRVREQVPEWDYLACLHRGNREWEYTVWPVSVRDRLPRVVVPLRDGYDDVVLDIQEGVNRCYTEGAFDRTIRYSTDPAPPLKPDDTVWMDTLLKENGLRPA